MIINFLGHMNFQVKLVLKRNGPNIHLTDVRNSADIYLVELTDLKKKTLIPCIAANSKFSTFFSSTIK